VSDQGHATALASAIEGARVVVADLSESDSDRGMSQRMYTMRVGLGIRLGPTRYRPLGTRSRVSLGRPQQRRTDKGRNRTWGKIVVCTMLSVDGYTEGPGGDVMAMPMDAAFAEHNTDRARTASSFLFGGPRIAGP
jgi:hypothetical protein